MQHIDKIISFYLLDNISTANGFISTAKEGTLHQSIGQLSTDSNLYLDDGSSQEHCLSHLKLLVIFLLQLVSHGIGLKTK